MLTNPKIGDWCFKEFKLSQIKEIEKGRITSTSDGYFVSSSWDLNDRCFPLDLEVLRSSSEVEYWSDKLHACKQKLNYPDINRKLVEIWVEMCENKDNVEKLKASYEKVRNFAQAVIDKSNALKENVVEGVSIFK